MKLSLKILAIAIIAVSTYSLIGCAAPASFSYSNISISFSATCSDCPAITYNPAAPQPPNPGSVLLMANSGQGGTSFITATITNAPPNNITWTVYPTPNLSDITILPSCPTTSTPCQPSEGGSLGTINAVGGNTIVYSVPGPPVYSGAALVQANAMGIPQGDVLLVASIPSDPGNPSAVYTASQLIQIYNAGTYPGPPSPYLTPHTPTTPSGLSNPVVTVARNTSYQFYGGVVGGAPCSSAAQCVFNGVTVPTSSTDNRAIWEVCPAPFALATCVVGGNSTLGTITQTGLYTAPANVVAALPAASAVVLVVPETAQTIINAGNYAYVGVN